MVRSTVDAVVARSAADVVAAFASVQGVIAAVAEDVVGPGLAVDDVVAVPAGQERVVAGTAEDGVLPVAAEDDVTASLTIQHVVAVATDDEVVSTASADEVAANVVRSNELSSREREVADFYATPAMLLLGQAGHVLRTQMFDTGNCGWVKAWATDPNNARFEWLDGPEVAIVALWLAAADVDGDLSGVPGLRLTSCYEDSARLTWYAPDEPVELSMTRIRL